MKGVDEVHWRLKENVCIHQRPVIARIEEAEANRVACCVQFQVEHKFPICTMMMDQNSDFWLQIFFIEFGMNNLLIQKNSTLTYINLNNREANFLNYYSKIQKNLIIKFSNQKLKNVFKKSLLWFKKSEIAFTFIRTNVLEDMPSLSFHGAEIFVFCH